MGSDWTRWRPEGSNRDPVTQGLPPVPFRPTSLPLERALAERDYTDPTPVQDAVLDPAAEGRDLIVSAQTGSGKTVAYGLALAKTLLGDAERFDQASQPLALVVAPTRELALQVHRELDWLYEHAGAKIVTCVGGMDPRAEQKKLVAGAHIVVGTPGRLRDHLERGRLQIGALKAVVLDEADEMLDLGFREDLEFILEATPESRRTLLFSATLPKAITALAKRYQRDAMRLEVSRGTTGHVDIEYRAVRIAPNEVEHAVVNLIRFAEAPSAIVFCNTRESVRHLYSGLLERGFSAVALSGELGQNERNAAMQA
ncbi:MAG: DEAD/DEAH box helicase, partial [Rhizobiaceae bacterium]|nr:DEAD/DEAH box helicase [Rhizobiaceae bacterium]